MARLLCVTALMIFPITILGGLTTSAAGTASDTLESGSNITDDGGATLVSAGGSFTLGFFSPTGVPTKRYLGIWFTVSPAEAIYWVANRETPLNDTSGALVLGSTGNLRLVDGSGRTAWSSSSSSNTTTSAPVMAQAQLLESGNLVVRDQSGGGGGVLWQSFEHPTNTLLAGMSYGKDPQTGAEWFLTSWREPNDPSPGNYRRVLDTRGLPDSVSWQGNVKKYRSGPWNGLWFSGIPDLASSPELYSHQLVVRPDEIAYFFNVTPGAPFSRLVLDELGVMHRLVWDPVTRVWNFFTQVPKDVCDDYAMCGAFGMCSTASSLLCSCAVGFSPVNNSQWSMGQYGGGCRRNVPLACGGGGNGTATTDGFKMVPAVKLPDTDNATVDIGATLEQCRARCLANCSCVAYAAADIRGGGHPSGCVMWTDAIVDVRYIDNGQDIYLRLARSELVDKKRTVLVILLPVTACLLALMGMFLVWIWRKHKLRGKRRNMEKMMVGHLDESNTLGDGNFDLPFFPFGDIVSATNNFADNNMLGQGGFGKIYKVIKIKEMICRKGPFSLDTYLSSTHSLPFNETHPSDAPRPLAASCARGAPTPIAIAHMPASSCHDGHHAVPLSSAVVASTSGHAHQGCHRSSPSPRRRGFRAGLVYGKCCSAFGCLLWHHPSSVHHA